MWGVFLPIYINQPLGQSTPKLPYEEPLVWEISRVVNHIFLILLSPLPLPSLSLSPPRCPARPYSPRQQVSPLPPRGCSLRLLHRHSCLSAVRGQSPRWTEPPVHQSGCAPVASRDHLLEIVVRPTKRCSFANAVHLLRHACPSAVCWPMIP